MIATIFMSPNSIFASLGALILLVPFLFGLSYLIYVTVRYFYWYNIKPIEPQYKRVLEKYFVYYNNLTPALKGVFERRVSLFVRAKDFYGQHGLEVTDEMRVLIAATGVQITFGFKFFQLPRFTKIFIFPEEYYSRITKKKHKGEVHPMGRVIKLSWNNFLKGFENPSDGINLGLHEMTHAMSLENSFASNGVSNFINPSAYRVWHKLAVTEMNIIRTTNNSIFRKYAATNIEEFLAVSVEVFFEQTVQFYEYNPMLYKATCNLLGQDTLPRKMKR
tara:strand:- start:32576 stop:33403 length:828 start_codon:yes stop_codon:yes gene_type:complete